MGTPCACIYATLFFDYHERKTILPKYKNNILLYQRQIDDILIIWVPSSENDKEWGDFVSDLNNCSFLNWETETPATKTHFLDLNLWINPSTRKINYSTYQKKMNLFLYIPTHSAHPKNTVKSLIYGLLHTYKRQNPNQKDFIQLANLLFKRLKVRGHQTNDLITNFKDALSRLQKQQSQQFLLTTKQSTSHPSLNTSSQTSSNTSTTISIYASTQTSSLQHPSSNTSSQTSLNTSTTISMNASTQTSLLQHLSSSDNTANPTPQHHTTPQIHTTPQRKISSMSNLPPDNQIFFHLQYHPKGTTRRTIQQTYNTQCTTTNPDNNNGFDHLPNEETGDILAIKKLTIAYHRPKNLQDILCPSTLQEYDNITVSSITSDLTK